VSIDEKTLFSLRSGKQKILKLCIPENKLPRKVPWGGCDGSLSTLIHRSSLNHEQGKSV